MELIEKNKVFISDARRAIYFNLLKCPNGNIRLYSNRWVKYHDTVSVGSKDGITFDRELILALKKSGATHNFFPFIGQDGKMYGIGGIDNWKHDKNFHDIKDYDTWKIAYENKFKKPVNPEVFQLEEHRRLLSNKRILDHVDGLYLFSSTDGKKWSQLSKVPIVTVEKEGFVNAMINFGKGSEFDGAVNCIWNDEIKKYILYIRANVDIGCRFIQYSVSDDLLSWEKFNLIKVEGYEKAKDNYYTPCFMKYKDWYIGLIPYFREGKGSIRLLRSRDGIKWDIVKDFFKEETAVFKDGKPKNSCHAVNGMLIKDGVINFYIHKNNLGLDSMSSVDVVRYTTTEKEMDEILCKNF